MAKQPAPSNKTVRVLRKLAMTYAEVDVAIACKGTALESSSFKVAKKSFLFLRPAELMLKLGASIDEAIEFAKANPDVCKVGAGGWVTIRIDVEAAPMEQVKRWLDESYQLFASKKPAAKTKRKK